MTKKEIDTILNEIRVMTAEAERRINKEDEKIV
jgi:hypothetical protein